VLLGGLLSCCALRIGSAAAQVPTVSSSLVTDLGQFLEPMEERALERKLRTYADTTSTQIVVVTVQDLGGMDAQTFALELGRQWGVGQEGRDNGVVLLVSRAERQIRIEVGYGLEGALPDALAARIIRDVVTPSFKQGQFFAGISSAVDLIMAAAAGEFEGLPTAPGSGDRGRGNPLFIYLGFLFLYFIISAFRNRGNGHRGNPLFIYLGFLFFYFIISAFRNRGNGHREYRKDTRAGLPIIFWGGGSYGHRGGGFGGGGFGGGGFGGGSFGGGGAGGSW